MNTETKARLIEMLKKEEGKRLNIYDDATGRLIDWNIARGLGLIKGIATCGHGRNIEAKDFSNCEILMMLSNDIQPVLYHCKTLSYWNNLSETRQIVVANMIFNLGFIGFKKFKKMNLALELGNYNRAAKEMGDSKWFDQVYPRSKNLQKMMIEDK